MSKSAFNTVLNNNIKDNNNKFVTPARHRTVLESLRDFIGWLAEANTWTGLNIFSAGVRFSASNTGTGTVTLTRSENMYAAPSGVTQVNAFATPASGDWHRIKNRSGGDITLSGNGNNLYTYQSTASITLINGQSAYIWFDGSFWNVN